MPEQKTNFQPVVFTLFTVGEEDSTERSTDGDLVFFEKAFLNEGGQGARCRNRRHKGHKLGVGVDDVGIFIENKYGNWEGVKVGEGHAVPVGVRFVCKWHHSTAAVVGMQYNGMHQSNGKMSWEVVL